MSFSLVVLVTIMMHIVGVEEKLAMYINQACYLVIICCCHLGGSHIAFIFKFIFVGKVC